MTYVIKEGPLDRWSDSKKSFESAYAKLLSNGFFQWFNYVNSTSPERSVDIKVISPFLAFGPVLHQVPCNPSVFSESDIDRSFGIPHEAHQGTALTFFRCSSQIEMASWMDSINRLLFGNLSANPEIIPQQALPVQSGPPLPYAPPQAAYPYQSNAACPPLPAGFAVGAGPDPSSMYPPPQMGMPYGTAPIPRPVQPTPQAAYPANYQPAPGPSYGYPSSNQQQMSNQPCFYDKKGKPYTIVYKDGKPKKKKWKKAALGLAAGAATGYVAGKMFGGLGRTLGYGLGGWGGGWGRPHYGGFGRWGSWSSLSSFSSGGGWSS